MDSLGMETGQAGGRKTDLVDGQDDRIHRFFPEWASVPEVLRRLMIRFCLCLAQALHEPASKTIYVLERNMENLNLDAVRLLLAHELVHYVIWAASKTIPDLERLLSEKYRLPDGELGGRQVFSVKVV